jgi:glycosyltransferase involved in cell wall biosynthesis
LGTLVLDSHFVQSDIVIYEFGIYYALFNSILALPGHVRKIVQYHNITPEGLVERDDQKAAVRRGMRQRANLFVADDILAVSEFNRRDLLQYGIQARKVQVLGLPLPDGFVPIRRPPLHPAEVEILFVGRFVPAKGVLDLVESVIAARAVCAAPLRLTLAGDTTWADPDYMQAIAGRIRTAQADSYIRIAGNLSQRDLVDTYRRAHIVAMPSYHEGYCLPVIEGLSRGCVVVGYDAGNLPFITNGLGRTVPAGDRGQLSEAVAQLSAAVAAGRLLHLDSGLCSYPDFLDRAFEYSREFEFDSYAAKFSGILRKELEATGAGA